MFRLKFLFLLFGLLFVACETKVVEQELILSNWTLTQAFRNEQSTKLLAGTFFTFLEDGTVKTNFLGEEETGTYEMKEDVLTLETSRKTNFKIKSLSETDLVITADLMGTAFRFILSKQVD